MLNKPYLAMAYGDCGAKNFDLEIARYFLSRKILVRSAIAAPAMSYNYLTIEIQGKG